jgi:uncharacterized protein (TIGR03435 family)
MASIGVSAQELIEKKLSFEVAAIKPIQLAVKGIPFVGTKISGRHVSFGRQTLGMLIKTAYGVKMYQIVAPDWVLEPNDGVVFDIEAELPEGASADQIPMMLQTLLADRFHLAIRKGTREFDTYGLIVGKGPLKISKREAPDEVEGEVDQRVFERFGGAKVFRISGGGSRIEASNIGGLVDYLSMVLNPPIIDKTGLKGSYDIKMEIPRLVVPRDASGKIALDREALTTLGTEGTLSAVNSLGLKLEPQKNPMETLIVEHIEKTPTEN